jgi:DNA segregation ATPase FtsK/SpoIIIE, S-DNA-T family
MKTLRLVSTPTRNRRLNEIIGMIVLATAVLLLLALASYTPSDPSFNTVGSYIKGRPAHNWTGMVGAYLADATLQLIGIAAFFEGWGFAGCGRARQDLRWPKPLVW